MSKFIIIVIAMALLFGGCAKPPREELQAARMAVARAYSSGAKELAAAEYQVADKALSEGERFVRQGNYKMAREVLPFAEALAHRAILRANEEQMIRELQKIREQEQAESLSQPEIKRPPTQTTKKTISSPPSTPGTRPLAPSLPPVSPQQSHYTVTVEESLWDISGHKEVYADPLLWPLIYKANRDQVKDPRRIYPGQILSIPRGVTAADLKDARERALRSDFFRVE